MIDGKPLELGALVGYWLNSKPTKVIHAAIYVGTGHWQLRRKTGMSDLSPRKHYVMEVCGPNQTIDLLGSQVVKLVRGKGGQMVQLSEMVPCRMWCAYELDSSHYGSPLNGRSTRSRALQFLNSSDGYDLFWNNCQHFAWAVARTGKMSQKIIDFKWVLHVDHELQMFIFEHEVAMQSQTQSETQKELQMFMLDLELSSEKGLAQAKSKLEIAWQIAWRKSNLASELDGALNKILRAIEAWNERP